jgi:hypothetical protein
VVLLIEDQLQTRNAQRERAGNVSFDPGHT